MVLVCVVVIVMAMATAMALALAMVMLMATVMFESVSSKLVAGVLEEAWRHHR